MPITKTVLKKVRQQAIVKLVGDGTANVDPHDVILSDETYGGVGNTRMNFNSILFTNGSSTTPITVARNGTTVMQLFGNDNWSFSQMMGFVDNTTNNANIAITIPSPGGTVFLGLTKVEGFEPPDNQSKKDYQKI